MSVSRLIFDEERWRAIIQKPDWYLVFVEFANEASQQLGEDTKEIRQLNKQVRHFFENSLAAGEVALGSNGLDWDSEREPVDTVVIHHTSAEPGYQLPY